MFQLNETACRGEFCMLGFWTAVLNNWMLMKVQSAGPKSLDSTELGSTSFCGLIVIETPAQESTGSKNLGEEKCFQHITCEL